MSPRSFFLQLGALSALTALGLFFFHQLPQLQAHAALGWISLVFFVLFCTAMFFAGRRAARSANKNDFTNAFLGFTVGKMLLSIMIIYAYLQLTKPTEKLFVLSFFGVYLVYTVFEVYFMAKLGRTGTS